VGGVNVCECLQCEYVSVWCPHYRTEDLKLTKLRSTVYTCVHI